MSLIGGGGMRFYLGRSDLRQRLSFGFVFIFRKPKRVFALRSWTHVTSSCSCCGTDDVYCRDNGDLPPAWKQDKGRECSVPFLSSLGLSAEALNSICSAWGT